MSQCRIYLENYPGTYYAGSEIKGSIQCYFEEETTLRGIKVRLVCKEYNEWMGTETYRDYQDNNREKTRSVNFTGDNNILYMEQVLYGSDSGNQVLNKGQYVYPFLYILPQDVPSSFKGPYGSITYVLQAAVDRPMAVDYEDKFIFSVSAPIDFNRTPGELQNPSTYSDRKSVCCWCCAGGSVAMDVELPRVAFVVGETVPFKVHVSNSSNSNVENLRVKFTKTSTFSVTSPTNEKKTAVEDVVAFNENGVGAHGEHTFDLQLAIPQNLEVPNFTRCTLFRVAYNLQVDCAMPACTMNLKVAVWDVQMGHVQKIGTSGPPQVPGFGDLGPPQVPSFGDLGPPQVPSFGDLRPPVVYPPGPGGIYPVIVGPANPNGQNNNYPSAPPPQLPPSYSQAHPGIQSPQQPQPK